MGKFIPEQGLFFEVVSADRKASLRSKLLSVPGAPVLEFDRTTYYRIPFWQAVDLIGKRQVKCWRRVALHVSCIPLALPFVPPVSPIGTCVLFP